MTARDSAPADGATDPTDAADPTVRELDAREVDGEPFEAIVSALDDLDADETLVLYNGFEPEPLYAVLDRRGFDYDPERVDPDEWRVEIVPR